MLCSMDVALTVAPLPQVERKVDVNAVGSYG
jgi:hypothetical protein